MVEVTINHFDAQTHVFIKLKVSMVYTVFHSFESKLKCGLRALILDNPIAFCILTVPTQPKLVSSKSFLPNLPP